MMPVGRSAGVGTFRGSEVVWLPNFSKIPLRSFRRLLKRVWDAGAEMETKLWSGYDDASRTIRGCWRILGICVVNVELFQDSNVATPGVS